MAQINNTVDPNDLDSIDALLDEAELESSAEEQPTADQAEGADNAEAMPATDDVPEEWPESETPEDPTEGLLDELDDDVDSSAEPEEKAEPEPEPTPEPPKEPEPEIADDASMGMMQQPMGSQKEMEAQAEDILEKRAQAAQAQRANNTIKGSDMDAIKKLIVIFSSITIFLVIVAISVGIWAALASGGSGLSEETLKKIDGIESNSTQSLMHTNTSEKTMKTLDKKLDALSFQLEQLNGDIAKMEQKGLKSASAEAAKEPEKAAVKPDEKAEKAKTNEAKLAPEIDAKLNKISAQMTSAQRRIYEVNQRVKRLQAVYAKLLKSIKSVEKQMVAEKVEKAPKAKSTEPKHSTNKPEEGGAYSAPAPSRQPYAPFNPGNAYSY